MAYKFQITIPVQVKPTKDSFDTRPKKVDEWIELLPRANVGETSKLLYQVLRVVNRLDRSSSERIRFMERIIEPTHYVLKSFEKHYLNLSFPLSTKHRKVLILSLDFLNELALGYKILVYQSIHKKTRLDKKSLALCIHRAIHYLSSLLECSYQIYAPQIPNIWMDINQLFAHAYDNKLHGLSYPEIKNTEDKSSIYLLYNRCILLSLTRPYSLRQGEIPKVSHAIYERWGRSSKLLSAVPIATSQGMFVVDLNSDTPPIYQSMYKGNHPDSCLGVDITEAITLLHKEVSEAGNSTIKQRLSKNSLDQNLLSRLITTWQINQQRDYPRLKNNTTMNITIGLTSTHHFIHEEEIKETKESKETEVEIPALPEVENKTPKKTLSDLIYGSQDNAFIRQAFPSIDGLHESKKPEMSKSGFTNFAPTPSVTKSVEKKEQPINYFMQHWTVVNISANGYCMMWDKEQKSQAQVGEIIGINERNKDNSTWSVGVIRWLKCRKDFGIEIGIEVLSTSVIPISMNSVQKKESKALLLAKIEASNQPASILASIMPYDINDIVDVQFTNSNITEQIKLTRLMESTTTYRHFMFSAVAKVIPTVIKDYDDHNENDDLDSIWSNL